MVSYVTQKSQLYMKKKKNPTIGLNWTNWRVWGVEIDPAKILLKGLKG